MMGAGPVREPIVAGQFYEGQADALRRQIASCYTGARGPGRLPQVNPSGPRAIVGLVSPHAGYVFSGAIAAHGFSRVAQDGVPDAAVIIGPSHRSPVPALQTTGSWRTPLGDVPIHEQLAGAIAERLPRFHDGPDGFSSEHSIEVQVPFVQHLYGDSCAIVPIMVARQDAAESRQVGEAIAAAAVETDVLIIASTDMTHYEPAEMAMAQDKILISLMERMDAEGLLRTRPDISMCGRGPVAAMLIAGSALGATRAEMGAYGHSGEVIAGSGVVGYVSVVVSR